MSSEMLRQIFMRFFLILNFIIQKIETRELLIKILLIPYLKNDMYLQKYFTHLQYYSSWKCYLLKSTI